MIDDGVHDGMHDAFGIFDRCSTFERGDVCPGIGNFEKRVRPRAFDAGEKSNARSNADRARLLTQAAEAVAEQCRCGAFDRVAVPTEEWERGARWRFDGRMVANVHAKAADGFANEIVEIKGARCDQGFATASAAHREPPKRCFIFPQCDNGQEKYSRLLR